MTIADNPIATQLSGPRRANRAGAMANAHQAPASGVLPPRRRPKLARGLLRSLAVGTVALSALAGPGCLYTDPINHENMKPSVKIVPPQVIVRGKETRFSATVSDPDGDQVSLGWLESPDPCPGNPGSESTWPSGWMTASSVQVFVDPGPTSPFCLWAFADDGRGGHAADALQINPGNNPPTADIQLVSPSSSAIYPLHSIFSFSGAGSFDPDGDTLAYQWELKPLGPNVAELTCPGSTANAPDATCYRIDAPGRYVVSLTVTDTLGDFDTASVTLDVAEDQLPCIDATSPSLDATTIVSDPMMPLQFEVTHVRDDADPYPPMSGPRTLHFQWFVGRGTDPVTYIGNDFPQYVIAANSFAAGELGRVRVEVMDRNTEKVRQALLACGDSDTCMDPTQVACLLRVTWKVDFR